MTPLPDRLRPLSESQRRHLDAEIAALEAYTDALREARNAGGWTRVLDDSADAAAQRLAQRLADDVVFYETFADLLAGES